MFTGLLVRVREREGTGRVSVECLSSVCRVCLNMILSHSYIVTIFIILHKTFSVQARGILHDS